MQRATAKIITSPDTPKAKGARGNPKGRGAKIVRGSENPTQSLAAQGVDKNLAKRARAPASAANCFT